MAKQTLLKHSIHFKQRMIWIKSHRTKVWNGKTKGDNLAIVSKAMTKRKTTTVVQEDLEELWEKTYNVELEKWHFLHPFTTTTPLAHLAENLIKFIQNGINFQDEPQADPHAVALIISPNDSNIVLASWLCGVRTILIRPNEFVNEAMSLKVNSIPQIYSNFL